MRKKSLMSKIAVVVTGQSRAYSGHKDLINKVITPYNADVYVSTWNEPVWSDKVLENFNPKAYTLHLHDQFIEEKRNWWNRYVKIADIARIPERRKFLNTRIGTDHVLKMFYLNNAACSMITEDYDYIIKVRPDLSISRSIPTLDLGPLTLPTTYLSKKCPMGDQIFWGRSREVKIALGLWGSDFHLFLARYVDPKITHIKQWVHPHQMFKMWMDYNNINVVYVDVGQDIIREDYDEKISTQRGIYYRPYMYDIVEVT